MNYEKNKIYTEGNYFLKSFCDIFMKGSHNINLQKHEKLKLFLNQNISLFSNSGGGGSTPELPNFELCARDFLEFAETELNSQSIRSKVNCVSNLKRAIDCAFDTFLYVFDLHSYIKKRNLKYEKKFLILKAIGIISPRSLIKLNQMRNKMEHSYEIPKTEDVEVYFDLVSSFISVLEAKMCSTMDSLLEFYIGISTVDNKDYFSIEYIFDKLPIIVVKWVIGGEKETISVGVDNYLEFMYFFRVYFLLVDYSNGMRNESSIINKINEEIEFG